MIAKQLNFKIILCILLLISACNSEPETQAPPEAPITPTDTSTPSPTDLPQPTSVPPTEGPSDSEVGHSSERAAQIVDRGMIRIGVRTSSIPPFVVVEGGYTGFEIEIARAIVERLFGSKIEIVWIGLSGGETFSSLQENQVDLVVRTIVHSKSRDGFALWSDPYFIGGLRILVRDGEGIASFADLDGKRVSVIESSNIQEVVRMAAETSDISVTQIVSDANDIAVAEFTDGRADAYINDWTYLLFTFGDDPTYQIVGDFLTRQPFAMALRVGEEDFQSDINGALRGIVEDGTYDSVYNNWFSEPHPWTLDEMLSEPPLED